MSDERLKKVLGEGRENRAAYDRVATESRELSDDARVEMFRQQFIQAALPDLPKIPGYHTCWLTTTNPRDSVQARIRLGYEPIKPEEVPGWEYCSIKTGEWQGFVGVNEMLAFKLPMSLYKKYMHAVHYDAPNQEEERLLGNVVAHFAGMLDVVAADADDLGGAHVDGFGEKGRAPGTGSAPK